MNFDRFVLSNTNYFGNNDEIIPFQRKKGRKGKKRGKGKKKKRKEKEKMSPRNSSIVIFAYSFTEFCIPFIVHLLLPGLCV